MSYEDKTYHDADSEPRYRYTEFIPLLKEFVFYIEPEVYLEIGVENGTTFNEISPLVKEAYACDINPMPNIKLRSNVRTYQMSSIELSYIWNKRIDLLFIDAGHTKESVLNDFNMFSPYIKECTGVIALHDTYPRFKELATIEFCNTAWEAAYEIRTNNKYKEFEIFTIPGPYAGLSLIRKAPKHLHWKD